MGLGNDPRRVRGRRTSRNPVLTTQPYGPGGIGRDRDSTGDGVSTRLDVTGRLARREQPWGQVCRRPSTPPQPPGSTGKADVLVTVGRGTTMDLSKTMPGTRRPQLPGGFPGPPLPHVGLPSRGVTRTRRKGGEERRPTGYLLSLLNADAVLPPDVSDV